MNAYETNGENAKEGDGSKKRIDVLVIDCLFSKGKHNTHYTLPDTIALIRKLQPKRALLVGMSCDDFLEHKEMNKVLEETFKDTDIRVELAHDGLCIRLDL